MGAIHTNRLGTTRPTIRGSDVCASRPHATAAMRRGSHRNPARDRLTGEKDGFKLAVPPRRERLWAATSGKHCRFGPEPVVGSAFRSACDWQSPEEPFAGAGPKVRIRLP